MRATTILVVLSLLVASTWAADCMYTQHSCFNNLTTSCLIEFWAVSHVFFLVTFSPDPYGESFVYGETSQTYYIIADATYPNVSLEIQSKFLRSFFLYFLHSFL